MLRSKTTKICISGILCSDARKLLSLGCFLWVLASQRFFFNKYFFHIFFSKPYICVNYLSDWDSLYDYRQRKSHWHNILWSGLFYCCFIKLLVLWRQIFISFLLDQTNHILTALILKRHLSSNCSDSKILFYCVYVFRFKFWEIRVKLFKRGVPLARV